MHARTRSDFTGGGQEVGTFDTTTSPTGVQVAAIIADAGLIVATRLGTVIPVSVQPMAALAVVRRSAMEIELSYSPDQIRNDQSPYKAHQALYESLMKDLGTAVSEAISGDDESFGASTEPRVSVGSFPPPIGFGTAGF